jgi:hypothetical protein
MRSLALFVAMMVTNLPVIVPIMMVPFVFSMAFFPIPVVLFIMMPVVNIPVRVSPPVMFPGFIMPVVPMMMIFFHLIITMPFAMRFMRTAVPVMGK